MEQTLKEIIYHAGQIALRYFYQGVDATYKKNPADTLTEADIAVSEYIVSQLKLKFPDHGILTEEDSEVINPESEYRWVIDPIDGTKNFAGRIPFWCTMVALTFRGKPILSAVYAPVFKQLFWAKANEGAYLVNTVGVFEDQIVESEQHASKEDLRKNKNATQIKEMLAVDVKILVTKPPPLRHVNGYFVIVESWPFYKNYLATAQQMLVRCDWLKSMGSMLQACYIATGGAHFYFCNYGYNFDYLPVVLLCQEAGAVVTNSEGGEWSEDRGDIVIAHPELHTEILRMLRGEES